MPPASAAPADVASWLTTDFIASFERDVDPYIWTLKDGHARGFFAITLLTLDYSNEAMASLLESKS